MKKQIFSEETLSSEPIFQPKQEFDESDVKIEEEAFSTEAELIIEKSLKPPRVWLRLFIATLVLLGIAIFAQSIQWLWDTFNDKQWIYFAFSLVFFLLSLTGIGVIVREWRRLVYLRKHQQYQQLSQQFYLDVIRTQTGEQAVKFCENLLKELKHTSSLTPSVTRWKQELNEAHNAKEVLYLFSENVLVPIDQQAQKLISKHAVENALIVAISPLATVDVLFIAIRNFALVNKITRLYGMELGYLSRLKLFKIVITNMIFAGATEIATDIGMDFFSQNLTAKFSMRAAQGIGIGLLTARLGTKAMEFCRPIAFQSNEKPKINHIKQALLASVKSQLFKTDKQAEHTQA